MKHWISVFCILLLLFSSTALSGDAEDVIVYSTYQNFNSRIYLIRMDGTVHSYYEYYNYRLVDLEVVNNEVYVAEAFAPRVYKVDLSTGNLDVIIDDWSLLYFYDIAFDGTYFYLDEWDLNRYDSNGVYNSTASFNETVYGSAWDGNYFWTLCNDNMVKCWSLSLWPQMFPVSDSSFSPPSADCRGLWYDGQYFWSAESKDNLGQIYKFNKSGQVVNQWTEPTFRGWAACLIEDFITGTGSNTTNKNLGFSLETNYPNPFNSNTRIEFSIPYTSFVTLEIYNSLGSVVSILMSENIQAGKYVVHWNADKLASGVYFYILQTDDHRASRKMILLK